MTKILLSGCNGRMGRAISEMCVNNPDVFVCAGVDLCTERNYNYAVYGDFNSITEAVDVVIDFSNPKVLPALLKFCVEKKLPVVLCTTGYSDAELDLVENASEKIPIFRSGNMSLGINVLISLARKAANILAERFDVEIIDTIIRNWMHQAVQQLCWLKRSNLFCLIRPNVFTTDILFAPSARITKLVSILCVAEPSLGNTRLYLPVQTRL